MKQSLDSSFTESIIKDLKTANGKFTELYPNYTFDRQPVHTVYGGANLFKSGAAAKLGGIALRNLNSHAPNFAVFAKILGFEGAEKLPSSGGRLTDLTKALEADAGSVKQSNYDAWLAYTIYQRVIEKLNREPIEDNRIDFEDGYGYRDDTEEDGHAISASNELAKGMEEGTLPPFIGIRVKSFTDECHARGFRTLDLFLTNLSSQTGGKLPDNFVITLPKVTIPEQVTALVKLLEGIEAKTEIAPNSLKLEIMIETTPSIINSDGMVNIRNLVNAGSGRCKSAVFGTYDYTSNCNIISTFQSHIHPSSDIARHFMQIQMSNTGINLVDGATTIMPIGPHRVPKGESLSDQQIEENRTVINSAWKLHYDNVFHSLVHAYYQGWDLNPAQLPIRYAAVYSFFLQSLDDASKRLNAFLGKAAQATLVGNHFDDAATGQGLLNYFLRGLACGAISKEEVLATGITMDELQSRSFMNIVKGRA